MLPSRLWTRVKRKTGRDDALKLARLASVGEIEGVPVPPRAARQWKSLIGFRKRIVSERVRRQNRIRGLLVCPGLPAPQGAKAWTAAGLAGIGQFAQPLTECGPDDLGRGELDRGPGPQAVGPLLGDPAQRQAVGAAGARGGDVRPGSSRG